MFVYFDSLRRLGSFSDWDLKCQIFESMLVTNVDDSGGDEFLADEVSGALDETAEEVFVGGLHAGLESVLLDFGQSLDNLESPSGLHHKITDPRELKIKMFWLYFNF